MTHAIPTLSYAYDALEPHIDAKTMEIHHSKHHQAYVDKLNLALEKHPDLAEKSVDDLITDLNAIPQDIRTAVRNHGGGHWNHSFFWSIMSPNAGGTPSGELSEAINTTWGSFEKFQEAFANAAIGVFGSGWIWLIKERDGTLSIMTTPNQDSPISQGKNPVLGLDVWEHGYYLKHQNRRAEYVKSWWNVVDWRTIEKYFNHL